MPGTPKKPGVPLALSRAASLMAKKGGSTPTDKAKGFRSFSKQKMMAIVAKSVSTRKAKRAARLAAAQ